MSNLKKRLRQRINRRRWRRSQRLQLTIQWQTEQVPQMVTTQVVRAANKAWLGHGRAMVNLVLINAADSQALNTQWRHKDKPTNILSFPFELPTGWAKQTPTILGDLLVCVPVVIAEAQAQQKTVRAHMTHLLVHGMLHLQGYDHETDEEAAVMEAIEVKVLAQLGIDNPYQWKDAEE